MPEVFLPALAYLLSFAALGFSGLPYYRVGPRLGLLLWPASILAGTLARLLATGGSLRALHGIHLRAPAAANAGALGRAFCQRRPSPPLGAAPDRPPRRELTILARDDGRVLALCRPRQVRR